MRQPITSTKQELEAVLIEAGARFDGSKVFCPYHQNEKTAAGSIYEQDGHWRYKCFGCDVSGDAVDLRARLTGGTVADVIKSNSNLYNRIGKPRVAHDSKQSKAQARPESLEQIRQSIRGTIEAQYPYYDADGELVALIIRYRTDSGKSFLPLRAEGEGFIRGAMPKPRPLYNLPQLVSADEVVICEGEKCVDALTQYGFTATTSAGGSNAAKQSDWKPLAGKRVILWRDNDEAGLKYIADIKQQLTGLNCEIFELEPSELDLMHKEDAADFVEQLFNIYAADDAAIKSEIDAALMKAKPAQAVIIDDLQMICAADVVPQQVQWLWHGFLAVGKLTLLASDPGAGKSTVSTDIAAKISTGAAWGIDGCGYAPEGETIFLSAEDDAADTIVPRLIAGDADLHKVHILEAVKEICPETGKERQRGFNLQKDLGRIGARLKRHNNVKLIVIDPISSYLGGVDSHKNADVRSVLSPLKTMAEAHGVAVLMITHRSKSSAKAAYTSIGSIAFSAAARISLVAMKDPDNEQRRVIMPAKVNLCPDNIGFAYTLEGTESGVARVVWERDIVSQSADDFINRESDKGEGSADADVTAYLQELLVEAHSFNEIQKKVKDAFGNIGEHKIRELTKRAGAENFKSDFQGGVKWKIIA